VLVELAQWSYVGQPIAETMTIVPVLLEYRLLDKSSVCREKERIIVLQLK